jgi:Fe-S-cluster containining protein
MTTIPPRYECDLCGACCKTFPVFVSPEDAAREPRIASEGREIVPWQRNPSWAYQLHPLPFHTGCCFLGSDNRCGIYETRPDVCRRFSAGSEQCQEAREAIGLPPLTPLSKD